LSGRGLCDELITRPEESYRLCCVGVCDLETSRMGAPYIYDISRLRVNNSNANEDIATKFEQEYVRCVRNEEECVCSAPSCCDTEQRSAS